MEKDESKPTDNRWINKMAFKKYVGFWAEGKELVELKKKSWVKPTIPTVIKDAGSSSTATEEMSDNELLSATQEMEEKITSGNQTTKVVPTSSSRDMFVPTISTQRKALLSGDHQGVETIQKTLLSTSFFKTSSSTITSQVPPSTTPIQKPLTTRTVLKPPTATTVQKLATATTVQEPPTTTTVQKPPTATTVQIPSTVVTTSSHHTVTRSIDSSQEMRETSTHQEVSDLCLPARWKKTLPAEDQAWISKTLFCWTKTGGVELVPEHLSKLWWYPPQPAVSVNSIPGVNRYFARPLFLWMPRKQWKVKLYCPQPSCERQELASAGINQKVRQVVDIDGYYSMACDNLECMKCRRRVLSWSHAILSQLDIGHRVQFPCILTAKLACDLKVVRLLRNRGLGNSCSQVQKKLEEQHGERWLQSVLHYLTDCSVFSSAADSSLLVRPTFADPPERVPLPKRRWLMNIFIQDVLHRLDEMKATITSVFGRILKMDSTKKVVKKLAGRPAKTALWCTNMGNEHGQILTSVLTSGEGHGLSPMLVGVINRFTSAQMASPEIIYVDRDCCGPSPLKQVLTASAWNTEIRLDIWHFMRRIAAGCTTDSHQLYSSFMGLLSNCIFHWDENDLSCLIESKRNELTAQHLFVQTDAEVIKHLSRYELALHCRRKTRGEAVTTKLISQLIQKFSGNQGRNTLGVPLINISRMNGIWEAQRKHIACIQNPLGVSLYTRTGSTRKGGVELPNYRCARGSTSLESFHLHLNRFIPGTLASDVLFQAYLVDGLHRWNEDRAQQATSTATDQQSYSGILRHTANVLGLKVLERKIVPTYNEPRKYTGEPIGIEYLYSQTGKVLDDYIKAIETLECTTEEEISTEEDVDRIDLIDDLTISTTGLKESSDLVLEDPVELYVKEHQQQIPSVPTTGSMVPTTSPTTGPMVPTTSPTTRWVVPTTVSVVPTTSPTTGSMVSTTSTSTGSMMPTTNPTTGPVLKIPTSEEYEAMLRDTIVSPAVTPPIDPSPLSVIQEESPGGAETNDSDSENEQSVGPDNIPGYGRVQELAAFLVSLCKEIYLSNVQVTHLIKLWNDLSDYDKAPTVFPERFSKEARGRFKAKKSVRNVVPGVESTERSIRGGPGAVPASWPNANRYTEAIFLQLLSSFPRNRTRFDDVTKAYYDIRQLVLQNGRVMNETRIQLPEISRGTLIQWNTKRGKDFDKLVVTQGVRFVEPPKTTSEGVPVALDKPDQLSSGRREPHVFVCPDNTAGMARFKGQRKKRSSHIHTASTRSISAQQEIQHIAPKSANPLTSPTLTSSITVPQSIHYFTSQQSTNIVAKSRSTSSLAAPMFVDPLPVPLSTKPFTAIKLTVSQPIFPVSIPLTSSQVHTSSGICYTPSCQPSPAVPTPQSTISSESSPTLPRVNVDEQSYILTTTSKAVPSNVPYSTQRNRKRKLELEKEGIIKRRYDRKKIPQCKQCGQERIPPSHCQYFMNWFCGVTSNVSFTEWKEELLRKGYGKKRKQ